jgi:hypothetical protein
MATDPNWTPAETLKFAPPGSQQMAVAAAGDVVHLVWVQAKTLYHARMVNGAWQAPVKVAGGEQPALAAAPDGTLYCTYANWFLGNRDIYVSVWANDKWGLSQVVSRTTGDSIDPAICVGPDGLVHLAWADTTPGYSVIYYAQRDPNGWTYAPVPNGKGSRPSVATSAPGQAGPVFVAWQDRLASSPGGAYEVFVTARRNGEWSLPAMVSDTHDSHSLLPSVAASGADKCHMVWQEERNGLYVIRHSDLWPNGWETPFDVSDPSVDSRLGFSLANKLGLFQFVWSEGGVLKHRVRPGEPQGAWWEPEVACDDCAGLSELSAAISAYGELHVVFGRWPNGGDLQFYHLRRKALERKKVFLPIVGR